MSELKDPTLAGCKDPARKASRLRRDLPALQIRILHDQDRARIMGEELQDLETILKKH